MDKRKKSTKECAVYTLSQAYTLSLKCIPYRPNVHPSVCPLFHLYALLVSMHFSLKCKPYLSNMNRSYQVYTRSTKCITTLSSIYPFLASQYPISCTPFVPSVRPFHQMYAFSLKCIPFIKYNTKACKDSVQI